MIVSFFYIFFLGCSVFPSPQKVAFDLIQFDLSYFNLQCLLLMPWR